MQKILEFIDALLTFSIGLVPGAMGAAVSLAYEKGLTWTDRFTQFAVGIVVSWFASRAMGAMFNLDPFVLQGAAFSIGMIAFRATPRVASAAIDTVAGLPAAIRDRFLPPKKD